MGLLDSVLSAVTQNAQGSNGGGWGDLIGQLGNNPQLIQVATSLLGNDGGVGGLEGLKKRCAANADALNKIVADRPWLGHLAVDHGIRSKTSVCLTVEGADEDFIKKFAALLDAEKAAYDIAGYRDAPAGLRIWCGATVDTADVEALGPWFDWAWATLKN